MTLPRDWMNRKDDPASLEDESLKDAWTLGKGLLYIALIVCGLAGFAFAVFQFIG
jgi:hypothetical protein